MTSNRSTLWLTLGMFLLVLIPVVIWGLVSTKSSVKPGQYDNLAKCLTVSGAKMYGAYWCTHCQSQKRTLGDSFQYVKYVECAVVGTDKLAAECQAAKIQSFPTWIFGSGERVEGEMTPEQLAAKSSCQP